MHNSLPLLNPNYSIGNVHPIDTWADASTLITTCRLNRVDPEAWLARTYSHAHCVEMGDLT